MIKLNIIIVTLGALLLAGCASNSAADLDAAPVAIFQTAPQYPFALRKADIAGRAVVDFVITSTGDVADVHVVSATDPAFGFAAAAAVLRWKFKPGFKSGRAVNVRTQVPIDFSLDDSTLRPAAEIAK